MKIWLCILGYIAVTTICLVEGSVDECYNELINERNWDHTEIDAELQLIYICQDEQLYIQCAEREIEKLPPSDYKDSLTRYFKENRQRIMEDCGKYLKK